MTLFQLADWNLNSQRRGMPSSQVIKNRLRSVRGESKALSSTAIGSHTARGQFQGRIDFPFRSASVEPENLERIYALARP